MHRGRTAALLSAIAVEAMGYGAIFGLLADLQDLHGFRDEWLGVIAAAAFPAALVGQLGLSRFADRGHTRRLLWFGLVTAGAGMVWFWLGEEVWEFVAARALVGLGSGTFIPAARRVVLANDPHNPGKAISMAGAADIGGFLSGIVIAKGLEILFGSEGTPDPHTPFLVLAVLLAVVGPIATLVPEPDIHERHASGDEMRRVYRIPLARAGIMIGLGFAAIIGTFDAIAARFIKDLGGESHEMIIVMAALFVPLVVAMPFAGRMVDRVGPVHAGCAALVTAAPLVLAFGVTRNLVVLACLGAVVALAYSAVYTAGQSAVAGGTIPVGLSGAGQGAYEATYATGSMISALAAPLLYDRDDALLVWAVVAAASLTAAGVAWLTAGGSRHQPVHLGALHDPELEEAAEAAEHRVEMAELERELDREPG